MWVLGTELRSPTTAANALTCWAVLATGLLFDLHVTKFLSKVPKSKNVSITRVLKVFLGGRGWGLGGEECWDLNPC